MACETSQIMNLRPFLRCAGHLSTLTLAILAVGRLAAADATVGLNFCDQNVAPRVADGIADGFSGWTDSRPAGNSASPATQSTPVLLGSSGVGVTWSASTAWSGGAESNNEQALYRVYLDDGGSGVRVTITGLSAWLAANGKLNYSIRCYVSSDSALAFRPISVRSGTSSSGTVLHTLQPPLLGNGNYPTTVTIPTSAGPARGWVDSPATLTDDAITLTIPTRSGTTRGTLAAFKITAATPATPPTASTGEATGLSESGATLGGVVNPKGGTATVAFQYGLTTAYGSTAAAVPANPTGTTDSAVSAVVTGLTAETVYHYRVAITTGVGTIYGGDRTFTTAKPSVFALVPAPFTIQVRSGETAGEELELENSGEGAGTWSAEILDGNGRPDSMAGALAAINTSGTAINGPLPDRYDFSEGETGTQINSGAANSGMSVFSQGNQLSTSLGGPIPYSDGVVSKSAALGAGGACFTKKLPGLFLFGAELDGAAWFEVNGYITYASGTRETSEFSITRNGRRWSAFVAKTQDYWRTINHLILVDQGGLTATTGTSSNEQKHRISGLTGKRRLFHLLYLSSTTAIQPDSVFESLAGRLLDALPLPLGGMVSATPASGTAAAGSTTPVALAANAAGVAPGTYPIRIQ